EYIPQRKIHLYHCDQRGLPLALITPDNTVAWRGEYDEWGNLSGEENPAHLEQLIRLPGQQYDEESGLYYNRYRYYNPGQGRYITQDPIGLKGGWNSYTYPLNPVADIDPLGLIAWMVIPGICAAGGCEAILVALGLSASVATQVDNAGRTVNPLADLLTQEHKSGVNPGGNCTPDELDKLQKQKDAFCNMPRSCGKKDSKFDLINKMNINLACAHTRKTINNKCFSGGNKTHMDQENDAFKSAVNCRRIFNGLE
ncbi:RHS element protein, partial [Salmonella enterica]|nr:RHS element protein [Salmonella enterica]